MNKMINVLNPYLFIDWFIFAFGALLKCKFTWGQNSKTQTQRSVFKRCVKPPQLSQEDF